MSAERTVVTTRVGIVGGGPSGLVLAHLLDRAGIESIVVEKRDKDAIHSTHRAGIPEAATVRMLAESGLDGRVRTQGHERPGTVLRFEGQSHRIDFHEFVGHSVWLYPHNEVFWDLATARERDGGGVRWSVIDTEVVDLATDRPGSGSPMRTAPPRRSAASSWSVPTARRASAAGLFRSRSARTTSSSTCSPGSASSPRPRRAPRNSSTPPPSTAPP